jgi:hypothetical protein
MDPVLVPYLAYGAVLALSAAVGSVAAASAARERAWRYAAEAAGLTHVTISTALGLISKLTAKAGPFSVRLEKYARGKYEHGTRIVIGGLRHKPGELSFRREGLGSALDKVIGLREMELGDPEFDDLVYLQGSPELARALFDEETRRTVTRVLKGFHQAPRSRAVELGDGARTALADDELSIELPERGWSFGDRQRASVALPALLHIAALLAKPNDIAARLAQNLERDPLEAVRLANLNALLERYHKHPRAREALEKAAREDASEEIRLRAALAVGTQGWNSLLAIASNMHSDDLHAARAIAGLGHHLSTEQALGILAEARRAGRLATAQACLERLSRRGGAEMIALLADILNSEGDALAAVAARALAATGEPAAEAPLIDALERHFSAELLEVVARELGRIGTAAAVVPLRQASDRERDGHFRRAARHAIAEIQARLRGAAPGQLSLAAGEAGQVTLTEDDAARGRVSLDDEDGSP